MKRRICMATSMAAAGEMFLHSMIAESWRRETEAAALYAQGGVHAVLSAAGDRLRRAGRTAGRSGGG